MRSFQYDPTFAGSGIEVALLTMPLSDRVYSFPNLSPESFHGLPGLLADSIPDRFGTALIDAWLARQGPADFLYADDAGVLPEHRDRIEATLRLDGFR